MTSDTNESAPSVPDKTGMNALAIVFFVAGVGGIIGAFVDPRITSPAGQVIVIIGGLILLFASGSCVYLTYFREPRTPPDNDPFHDPWYSNSDWRNSA